VLDARPQPQPAGGTGPGPSRLRQLSTAAVLVTWSVFRRDQPRAGTNGEAAGRRRARLRQTGLKARHLPPRRDAAAFVTQSPQAAGPTAALHPATLHSTANVARWQPTCPARSLIPAAVPGRTGRAASATAIRPSSCRPTACAERAGSDAAWRPWRGGKAARRGPFVLIRHVGESGNASRHARCARTLAASSSRQRPEQPLGRPEQRVTSAFAAYLKGPVIWAADCGPHAAGDLTSPTYTPTRRCYSDEISSSVSAGGPLRRACHRAARRRPPAALAVPRRPATECCPCLRPPTAEALATAIAWEAPSRG